MPTRKGFLFPPVLQGPLLLLPDVFMYFQYSSFHSSVMPFWPTQTVKPYGIQEPGFLRSLLLAAACHIPRTENQFRSKQYRYIWPQPCISHNNTGGSIFYRLLKKLRRTQALPAVFPVHPGSLLPASAAILKGSL